MLQPKQKQVPEKRDMNSFVNGSLFSIGVEKQYHFEVPEFVKNEVEAELTLIESHQGYNSLLFSSIRKTIPNTYQEAIILAQRNCKIISKLSCGMVE